MSLSVESKKKLLAKYGPTCWNGNCGGPPKCLLKHPNKKYQLRQSRSHSSASWSEAEHEEETSNTIRRTNSFGELKNEAKIEKDELHTLTLAIKRSLEITCSICGEVLPSKDELQLHALEHGENDERDAEEPNIIVIDENEDIEIKIKTDKEDEVAATGVEGKREEEEVYEEVEHVMRKVIENVEEKRKEDENDDDVQWLSSGQERKTSEIEEELRDEIQQLKNSMKIIKTSLEDKNVTIQNLETQVKKLGESNKLKDQEYRRVKKNLIQHQCNEKEFKEKAESLESENEDLKRTIAQLNNHLEHLQTTMNLTSDDEDEETINGVEENTNGGSVDSTARTSSNQINNPEESTINNKTTETITIQNFGGGEMSINSMEKLLGLDHPDNVEVKKEFEVKVIDRKKAEIKCPSRLTQQILQLNNLEINGKKLEVELVKGITRQKKPCYYFRKGRCEKGATCQFSHRPTIPCRDFRNGRCTRNPCKFLHEEETPDVGEESKEKTVCKFFKRGNCREGERCKYVHPLCRNFERKVECKFGTNCRFICYKDQEEDLAKYRQQHPIPAAMNSGVQVKGPSDRPIAVNMNSPTQGGANVMQQGVQVPPIKTGMNEGTNNPISFLGQKVDGLERVVSHLLQLMLRPAYCPPIMPQIQQPIR